MKSLLLLALIIPAAAVAQDTTVYDFYADTGLTGSITLDSGTSGPVTLGDIVAFDFTSAPTGTLTAAMSGAVASSFGLQTTGMLTVTGNDLYFDPPSDIVGSENLDGYYGIAFDNGSQSAQSPQPDFILTDDPGLQGGIGNGSATADVVSYNEDLAYDPPSPAPAPEIDPNYGLPAVTLLAGILAVIRGRRR